MDLRTKRIVLYTSCLVGGVVGDQVFWRALQAVSVEFLNLPLRLDRIGTMYHIYTMILIAAILVVILDAFAKTEILKS